MAIDHDLISTEDAAQTLGVTVRHVHRLADTGILTKVAPGRIDRGSLERYIGEQRSGRTRSWAEHTAWGAIALLSGRDASWLGDVQASRVRRTLLNLTDPTNLLVRTRDRATTHTFSAHTSALPRLRDKLAVADLAKLGIVEAAEDSMVDGYLAAEELDSTVQNFGLRADSSGNVTLRTTHFDFHMVANLATNSAVVAALDAATSLDPRIRGVGERALTGVLDAYR